MKKLLLTLLLFSSVSCSKPNSGHQPESCEGNECWAPAYSMVFGAGHVIDFDSVTYEQCTVTVEFGPNERLPPIQDAPVLVLRELRESQATFEVDTKVLILGGDWVARVTEQRVESGLMTFTRYVDNLATVETRTIVTCGNESYDTSDDLQVMEWFIERPEDGILRPYEMRVPWQDLVDKALREAKGEDSITMSDYGCWYREPSEANVDPEPEERQ